MSEQTWLNWEQEIALTAAQTKEAEFTRKQRARLVKFLEWRFQAIPTTLRDQIEAASLERVEAALDSIPTVGALEDLKF